MKRIFLQVVNPLLMLIILAGVGYYFHPTLLDAGKVLKEMIFPTPPCTQPITYQLKSFDERFDISRESFLSIMKEAEKIWEVPLDKNLFNYTDDGDVDVHVIYDYRQQTTENLAEIDNVIDSNREKYDAAKAQYNALNATYKQQKRALDDMISAYTAHKNEYEKQVAYWNARGGAPKKEVQKLEQDREALNEEVRTINEAQASLNALITKINSTVAKINQLAKALNLHVQSYNTIGASAGEEFSEGEFIHDSSGDTINIYQFESRNRLLRVLAHELGHAIGLEHVDDPDAIMYRLNEGVGSIATHADVEALKDICYSR